MYLPEKGYARFDRVFEGVGRITNSSETRDPKEFAERNAILTALYDDDQLESLRAFKDGLLSMRELLVAKRKGRLSDEYLLERIKLDQPLWRAIDATLPELGESPKTRQRYEVSRNKLRKYGGLRDNARVRDLRRVHWKLIRQRWPGRSGQPPCSAADWMQLRRFLSSFLSTYLGDVYHPFRRAVMQLIPTVKEKERIVEITVEQFWTLVEHIPEHARPGYVALAATGMRLGEYLACAKAHLNSAALSVRIPSGKTGADVVYVAESLWPWIEAAIPAPVAERWMHEYFYRAALATGLGHLVSDATGRVLDTRVRPSGKERAVLRAMAAGGTFMRRDAGRSTWDLRDRGDTVPLRVRAGLVAALVERGWLTTRHAMTDLGRALAEPFRYEGIRIHDLRHMHGQVAIDAGAPESKVQSALRHETASMTRRYVRRKAKRDVSELVGQALTRPRP